MKARHTFSLAFLASLLLTGGLAADDEKISAQLNSAKKLEPPNSHVRSGTGLPLVRS